jgi:signal transduction histidine kinase
LLKGSGERPKLILGVTHDITDRKQAAKLIHDLSHQLLTSQESERQRISFELHDSVAQDLSTSKIICEMLLKDNSFRPEVRKQVSEISENLHKTLSNVRDLSYELRPPGLEDLGLTHTMHELCDDFSKKTGVRNDFQSAGMDSLNLNYNTKINLYRVLQEALNNVRKHSDASNVKIRLIASFPNIILRIEDDGKGFDLKDRLTRTSNEKRMGLSSMEERVGLLLGRIDIKSIPGKGTKVFIEIPQRDENIGASD